VPSRKRIKEIFVLFVKSKMGLAGLILLIILASLAVLFPVVGDQEKINNWRNYEYWIDYPKKVPPCWAQRNSFPTQIIAGEDTESYEHEVFRVDDLTVHSYIIRFTVERNTPASMNLRLNVSYNKTTYVYIAIVRPDGQIVNLTNSYESPTLTSMRTVFGVSSSSYNGTVYKNLASYINNPQIANLYIAPWLEANNIVVGSTELSVLSSKGSQIIFMKLTPAILTNPELLEGEYKLRIDIISKDELVSTGFASLSLIGTCYGVLGTDVYGRDLSQAVLYGIRWALIIGLLVAFVSTLAGGLYGILSGYYGGLIDEILLRIAQIVYSIPVLPLLIILSYMLKPSIWNLVGLLIAFGWPGTALVTRSMALQLKEETYVEAARAFGASHGRIILKYILPQTLPYLFASMALGVPGAILTEAAVSFLGLGDPTKITWGRILNEAQASMATVNGYWWWVIPPGLMIMVTGTTFIFIGYALDTVLNPRLKR